MPIIMFVFYIFSFLTVTVDASCWCAPGTFCSRNSDGCHRCPHGKYMDEYNNDTECKRCYPSCDGGKVTVQNCTPTSNRLCQCPTTKYWDSVLHICRDCTECENSQRKVQHCGSEHDSVCQDCPEGTYLGSYNTCNKCSMCKKGQLVVGECTTTKDTICKTVGNKTVATPKLTPVRTEQPTKSSIGDGANKGDVKDTCPTPDVQMALIWGSIMGTGVTLAVIAILIFLRFLWNKRSGKNLEFGSPVAEVVSKEKMKEKMEESIKEKGLKVRDLNYCYIERLSTLLNPQTDKNWKSLAGLMNYNVDFVANLELQPQKATSRLLQDWGVSNDATVYRLYCLLKQLPRDDAAAVLKAPLLAKQTAEYV